MNKPIANISILISALFLTLIASLWVFTPLAQAQEPTQTIRGTVVDKASKTPLFGANVAVIDGVKLLGSMTDVDGKFRVENVSVGRHDIKVSYLGYEDVILPSVLVSSGREVVLSVELTESVTQLNQVIVKGQKPGSREPINSMATASAQSFSIEQTQRYAASANDPARLVLSFAGIKNQGDIINGISVRGNNPRYVQWRVDGIEVPDPNHFSQEGYGGGAVSMLSSQVLSASDFYTGAFPAEFGNVLAAAFDLRLRKGNNEKREYTFQAGMLGVEGALEGPFSKKGKSSYLVNYRYSTLALMEKIGYNVGNAISSYQDLNMKLNFPTKRAGTFSVFSIAGLSSLKVPGETNAKDEQIKTYDMGIIGLSHGISINKKNYLKTTVSIAANQETTNRNNITTYYKRPVYDLNSSNIWARAKVELSTKLNARIQTRTGLVVSRLNFKLNDNWSSQKKDQFTADGHSYLIQFYSQRKQRFTDKLSLLSGIHFTYFALNNNYSVEPRLGLQWDVAPKHSLNFATGLHSQMESLAYYMLENPNGNPSANKDLDFIKAFHAVASYKYFIQPYLVFKLEAYFQYLYDVPVRNNRKSTYSILNNIERYTYKKLVNKGLGKNYGIEISLEKTFSKNYYFLFNQSLFDAQYMAGDGIWRHTRFAANYITSVTGGKDIAIGKNGRKNVLGLNARILWSGGERTQWSDFEEKIKDYFRLDTRFSYTRNKPKYAWQVSLDIQNLTNRLNENLLQDIDPVGILPIFNYKVMFSSRK